MLDREIEYQLMAEVEQSLWWYRCLHSLVIRSIKRHSNSSQPNILDAGCGTGGLLLALKKSGYTAARGFDLSPHALKYAREHGLSVMEGDLRSLNALSAPDSLDVITANDTLLYLSPPELKQFGLSAHKLLRPGGICIANLPALSIFRGQHDLSVGITHRFSRADIPAIFDPNLFEALRVTYWPFLISPLIMAERARQRLSLFLNPNAVIESDVKSINRVVNWILFNVTELENKIFRKKPFGSSLFIVMRKRN